MGILSGNPKNEPMHYGEVYGLWSFLLAGKTLIAANETNLNHVGDADLHTLLSEAIQQGKQEVKEIEECLKEIGVGLPPTPPQRSKARLEDIPVGARFMDPEISAGLAAETAAGLVLCSQMIGQSIREDIAMMFGKFHVQKAALGAKILRLNKDKGWLIPPPLHHYPVEDC